MPDHFQTQFKNDETEMETKIRQIIPDIKATSMFARYVMFRLCQVMIGESRIGTVWSGKTRIFNFQTDKNRKIQTRIAVAAQS